MQRILSFFQDRIFKRFFLSYLSVCLLPMLVVALILYQFNIDSVRRANNETMMQSARQTVLMLDAQLQSYMRCELSLSSNADAKKLLYPADSILSSTDEQNALLLWRIRQAFATLTAPLSGVRSAAVYFKQINYCLTGTNALPTATFYQNQFGDRKDFPDYETFCTLLDSPLSGSLCNLNGALLYFKALPFQLSGEQQGVLMIELSTNALHKMMFLSQDQPVYTALISARTLEPLFETGGQTPADLSFLTGPYGVCDRGNAITAYYRSELADYYIVTSYEKDVLYRRIAIVRNITLLMLCVLVLICAIVTYYYMIRQYNPLRQLLWMAKKEVSLDLYTDLRQTMLDALDAQRKLEIFSSRTSILEKDQRLFRAFSTPQAYDQVMERFAENHYAPNYSSYTIVRVLLQDRYSELFRIQNDKFAQYDYMFIYNNVFRELLEHQHAWPVISIFLPDELLLLINADEGVRFDDLLEYARSFLKNNYSYDTFIAANSMRVRQEWFSQAMELLLRQSDELIHRYAAGSDRNLVYYNDEAKDYSQSEPKSEALSRAVRRVQTAVGTQEEQTLIARITELVGSHYEDANMNVTAIAYRLDRNVDYISRLFKQKVGVGLLDYIHYTRINASKTLLMDEKLSITAIAGQVGYSNVDSFIRVFKRIENVTPSQYRKGSQTEA